VRGIRRILRIEELKKQKALSLAQKDCQRNQSDSDNPKNNALTATALVLISHSGSTA
jgi:hypothetical protein